MRKKAKEKRKKHVKKYNNSGPHLVHSIAVSVKVQAQNDTSF